MNPEITYREYYLFIDALIPAPVAAFRKGPDYAPPKPHSKLELLSVIDRSAYDKQFLLVGIFTEAATKQKLELANLKAETLTLRKANRRLNKLQAELHSRKETRQPLAHVSTTERRPILEEGNEHYRQMDAMKTPPAHSPKERAMDRFDYIKYDEISVGKQNYIKERFQIATPTVEEKLTPGRAKSIILTKLEEAYMWVGKAIRDEQFVRNGCIELQEKRKDGF